MKRILHFIPIVLCLATGVAVVMSHVRPISVEFSPSDFWVHARGDLARCRIIFLVPKLSHPTQEQAYMLQLHKRDLSADPRTSRLGVERIWVRWPGNETTARGVRINFSLYIPLIVFALPFVLPLWRAAARRYPPRAVWLEVLRPSESCSSSRRAIRRTAIASLIFLGIAWCIPWLAAGFDGPWSIGSTQGFDICKSVGDVSVGVGNGRSLSFQNYLGSKSVTYAYNAAGLAETVDLDHRLGPFSVRHTAAVGYRVQPVGWDGTAGSVEQAPLHGTLTISGPAWAVPAVFMLLCLYPVIAAFRGPVGRARRQAWMTCRRCGYDLHGLTNPRCPECGAGFRPERPPANRLTAFIQKPTGLKDR